MKDCYKIQKLLSKYVDKETSSTETETVKLHLDKCAGCRDNFLELCEVKKVIVETPRKSESENYLIEKIRSKIFEEKFALESTSWMEKIGMVSRKFIPVPVSILFLAVFFLVYSPGYEVRDITVEDNIISGEQTTTDTVIGIILGEYNNGGVK